MLSFRYTALLLAGSFTWAQNPDTIIRGGTRYVEVDVTVRHKRVRPPGVREFLKWAIDSGPPFGPPGVPYEGLAKEDFTLLDNGVPQPIADFRRELRDPRAELPVPSGAFSNRTAAGTANLTGATIILVDLLNTPFHLTGYARKGFEEVLPTLAQLDGRVAVYSLGKELHVLHSLTDDPEQLRSSILQAGDGKVPPEFAQALRDTGEILGVAGGRSVAFQEQRIRRSLLALHDILQHLSGLPGRKNLIWLSQEAPLYPTTLALIERANVALYPVRVRGADSKLATYNSLTSFARQTAFGGRAFFDARDLVYAAQTANEDLRTHYVLGFYPSENQLDGTSHNLTVTIGGAHEDAAEVHYRRNYTATRDLLSAAVPGQTPSLYQALQSALPSTGVGLIARATADPRAAGAFRVQVTVDLHDVRMRYQGGRFLGALEFAAPDPSSPEVLKTASIALDLSEERYLSSLLNGYTFAASGLMPVNGEIRLVLRDAATALLGSVRVPVSTP